MAISGILSTAVSGLANASSRVAASADNIVNANTPGYQAKEVRSSTIVTQQTSGTNYASGGVSSVIRTNPDPTVVNGSNVDIANEFIKIIQAEIAYKASLEVISTSEDLAKDLINIRA